MTKIVCDRCACVTGETGDKALILHPGYVVSARREYDLCGSCLDEVKIWLDTGRSQQRRPPLPDPMPLDQQETLNGHRTWDGTWRWPWRKKRRPPE